MAFVVAGTNHKFAPVEIREKLAFSKKRLCEAVSFFGNAVILSTCNRVEVYTDENLDLKQMLCKYHELNAADFYPYLYEYTDDAAFAHLCRVAAGLDSQICGEKEILGQVRFAYDTARPEGLLNRMFTDAFRAARHLRSKNNFNASIGKTVKDFLGPIKSKKVIILGRGDTGRIIAEYLNNSCEIIAYKDLKEKIKTADVLISATGSPHLVVRKEDIPRKPLIILDIAVPRDVEPAVRDINGVELFTPDEICAGSEPERAGSPACRLKNF